MKNFKRALSLVLALTMALGMTMTVALAEGNTTKVEVDRITTSTEDNLSSFSGGGWTEADDDYAFVSALFVNGGKIDERSVTQAIQGGTYDANGADGVKIVSKAEGFNPIIVHDSKYTIKNAEIIIDSKGDGTVTNDFSGYGAAIATYGDDTVVTLENSKVWTAGVANLTVFTDDGSDIVIKNSELHSDGGTLYEAYKNSPDQTTMVAPPWILGIMGTSRCTNLMGTNSSMTVLDSKTTAAQWAILSTDSGTKMTLTVINSYMGLTGADYDLQEGPWFGTEAGKTSNPYSDKAGYGTYTIGSSNQKFYGVDMVVGTYANIYTGGQGLYTSMTAGEAIDYLDANDTVVGTYTPADSKVTTITSDTFGFMIHQGSNALTIEKGTVVDSGYTTFLLKTGCTMDANITSGAVLNPGNGIILQVLDNDDATTGMDVSTFSFYTTHTEYAGWPTEGTTTVNSPSSFTFEDVTLVGDIFNGSGWVLNDVGGQKASPVVITLSGNTTLVGQISSTAAIHVTKEGSDAVKAAPAGQKASDEWVKYQNTEFTMSEYYDIGQVANRVQSNGLNTVDVVVEGNAKWTVTADGIVKNVTAASSAIVAEKPVTLTVEGVLTLDGKVVTEDITVGNVTYKLNYTTVDPEDIDVSTWIVGNIYTGAPDLGGATTIAGTDKSVKIVDGDGNGEVSKGDAVLQYEASQMLGWVAEDGSLTTTYPTEGGESGGGMGGMMGGPGGPGMGGGASDPVVLNGKIVVELAEDGTVVTVTPTYNTAVSPETGDTSVMLYVVLAAIAAISLAGVVVLKKEQF